jgi:glycosyltransferase involved in cell wall biosynthesis
LASNLNIIWINHRDPKHPQAGGAEVRMHEVGKRLVQYGYSVKLICERWAGSAKVESLDGIEIVRVAGKRAIHLLTPFLLNRADGYDVIIDDIAHGVPWGSSFFTNRPVIGQVHHVHQEVLRLELNPFLGRLVALSERTIKYSYKTLIVVSESTKRALVENFGIAGNRIKVIPSGVDMEFYRPTMKSSSPTVLWVGRLKRYKRVEHILSAFRSVKKRLPTAKLVIVGDGDHTEALKNMAKTLGLSDVVFAGKVSEEKKAVFMASSWVAVSSSFIEGWGMTITECAACGTPAVAYDVPGLRDAIRNNETGLLVDNGNIKALAQALTRVLEDEKLRMRLSKNALHYTSEFSWDKVAKEFISFLELTKNRGYV